MKQTASIWVCSALLLWRFPNIFTAVPRQGSSIHATCVWRIWTAKIFTCTGKIPNSSLLRFHLLRFIWKKAKFEFCIIINQTEEKKLSVAQIAATGISSPMSTKSHTVTKHQGYQRCQAAQSALGRGYYARVSWQLDCNKIEETRENYVD